MIDFDSVAPIAFSGTTYSVDLFPKILRISRMIHQLAVPYNDIETKRICN